MDPLLLVAEKADKPEPRASRLAFHVAHNEASHTHTRTHTHNTHNKHPLIVASRLAFHVAHN